MYSTASVAASGSSKPRWPPRRQCRHTYASEYRITQQLPQSRRNIAHVESRRRGVALYPPRTRNIWEDTCARCARTHEHPERRENPLLTSRRPRGHDRSRARVLQSHGRCVDVQVQGGQRACVHGQRPGPVEVQSSTVRHAHMQAHVVSVENFSHSSLTVPHQFLSDA